MYQERRIAEVREPRALLPELEARIKTTTDQAEQLAKPKPEPLAIVPSGLPIAEVVQRLQELQEQHPDAEVRRGRANRWELWPRRTTEPTDRPTK